MDWPARRRTAFRSALLLWYRADRRELPWRRNRDPYRVWVSEIMLQQTRVAAVEQYFERFLKRFPTVADLARARLSSVLAAWSGLGYYRRARMLHAAARVIVRGPGGRFPRTLDEWRALPGIGRYTAAAIASIAFDAPHAVVDGNVERVLQRLAGRELPGNSAWIAAESLLSRDAPGDFNQAMMELGATVCVPGQPRCDVCPVREFCGTRGDLPRRRAAVRKTATVGYTLAVRGSSVLLVQRPRDAARMAQMWELPECRVNGVRPLLRLRHSITDTDYDVRVYRSNKTTAAGGGAWVPLASAGRLPLTGLARKILNRVVI